MTQLSVNINKIALLRNSRGRNYPDPAWFARKCLDLGAHGVTLHPRPDQRHARYEDIFTLRTLCDTYGVELNVEGYPSETLIQKVIEANADQFTLVPDDPNQITSDHGWHFSNNLDLLKSVVDRVQPHGIRVSLFCDYDNDEIEMVHKQIGAERLEFYTEPYAESYGTEKQSAILDQFADATKRALQSGLDCNAGHDLSLDNLKAYVEQIPVTKEVSIGHALIVECLEMGIEKVINGYLEILNHSTNQ